ncbi:MAG: pyruvate ferredoxin oxidoreductase [Candidatus Aenigmatarchaeota archaeon]|nr:MAG: pyruvate ferredoxin oxidoreductase [Candidatus Aenigmarchaeota archaeon]
MRVPLTGAYAAAEAMRQINPDVVAAYPITPQSPIMELFAKFVSDGKVDTELITVESEHSAMSACVGSAAAGARTMTASSSQGIALMFEILPIAAGLRLPILMEVATRALSSPLNIHCDHSDVMSVRDSGWIQIFCENAQEVYENTLFGLKLAEEIKLPAMIIQDGFITSHSVEGVNIFDDEIVKDFVGEYKPSYSLLDIDNPITVGAFALPDYYFEIKRKQEEGMRETKKKYLEVGDKLKKITNNSYPYFESYKLKDAKYVIVAAGSTAGTMKEVVDKIREKGEKVGLLKIKLFRPFPAKEIKETLEDKKIAVLDRSLSFGTFPPIYSEIKKLIPNVQSYVYGLGGRDVFSSDIKKVFDDLKNKEVSDEIRFLGLRE